MNRTKTYVLLFAFAGICSGVSAATKTFSGSGNWNTAARWSPSGVPATTDDIIIASGADCDITAGVTCNNLTINATGILNSDDKSLTVNGTFVVNGTFNETNKNGNINFVGLVTINGTWNCTANEDFVFKGGLTINGSGTIGYGNGEYKFTTNNQTLTQNSTADFNGALTINDITLTLATSLSLNNTLKYSNNSSKLNLNGKTLTLKANITGNGFMIGSSSSNLSASGTTDNIGSLRMDQASASTRTLNNLTINRSGKAVTIANAIEITGILTVTAGTFNTDNTVTLIATAASEARVAKVTGTISGNVTVQKYIPAGSSRRWIHMASPTGSFTWTQLKDDIFVTGANGGNFDQNNTYFSSALTYLESTAGDCGPNGWVPPTNINNNVAASKGMKVFFRGDRDPARLASSNGPPPNAVTIDYYGALNSGTQNLNVTYTNSGNINWDGWNFVANPYASPINWNAATGWTKTRMSGTIYVWNAAAGTYATWNGSSGTNGMSNGLIAMGQSFWVKATAANPVLSMTEDVKSTIAASGFFKGNAAEPMHSFRVTMVKDEIVKDELLFNFDQSYSRSFEEHSDALKLFNTSINIWAKSEEGKDLVINNYPSAIANDTVVLGMTSSTEGIFNLEFDIDSIPSHISVLLIDSYRNRVIDVRKEKTWKVLINSEAASFATGRLKLVFISQASQTLQLNASLQPGKKVNVEWATNMEINTASYAVEHSTDNLSFATAHTAIVGDSLILAPSAYTFLHAQPITGINYYRVKRISSLGQTGFSEVKEVTVEETSTHDIKDILHNLISVYPIPARTVLNVTLTQGFGTDVLFEIINLNGAVVLSQSSNLPNLSLHIQQLPAGIYLLKASAPSFYACRKIIKQ